MWKKWILFLIGAVLVIATINVIIFYCLRFSYFSQSKGQFVLWDKTMVSERLISAPLLYAILSPDRKKVAVVKKKTDIIDETILFIYKINPDFKSLEIIYHTLPDYTRPPYFYIWNFFWIGDFLLMKYIWGVSSSYEMEGNWKQYENAGIVELVKDFGMARIIMRGVYLYSGFVPDPDEKTFAILTDIGKDEKGKYYKGFLYSIPEGKKLREIKWRGPSIGGGFSTSSFPQPILFWDKKEKKAWVVSEEQIKLYGGVILSLSH